MSHQDSVSYLMRALAIDEKALGPEHPTTATVRENYQLFLSDMKRRGKGQH